MEEEGMKRCNILSNCFSSDKPELFPVTPKSFAHYLQALPQHISVEVIHSPEMAFHSQEECHLFRHKVKLSLIQEYFSCRQIGSMLLG